MSAPADAVAPWLSVLMPVFNGAEMIGATLASLDGQAEGIEVILVDQGSTDDSCAIAESFADRINLRIVAAPDNRGWVENTNLALSLARAERATLLHQDDLWRPGRAALLQEMFAAAPDAALWLHGADYVDARGRGIGGLAPPLGPRPRRVVAAEMLACLLVQNTIPIPTAAFPVAAAREIGGLDPALWYTADWDFWLSLAQRGDTAWRPERAAAFRLHGGSLTVRGTRDLEDLAAQLDAPVERHSAALPAGSGRSVLAMAQVSNLLNVWLASLLHGERRPVWPLLKAGLALGPGGWGPFFHRTRVVARVWPRVRLFRYGVTRD